MSKYKNIFPLPRETVSKSVVASIPPFLECFLINVLLGCLWRARRSTKCFKFQNISNKSQQLSLKQREDAYKKTCTVIWDDYPLKNLWGEISIELRAKGEASYHESYHRYFNRKFHLFLLKYLWYFPADI